MTRRLWAAALAAGFAVFEGGACSLPFGTEEPPPAEVGESRIIHGIPVTVRVRDADVTRARAAIDVAFAAAEETAGKLLAGLPGSELDILARVPSHLWLEISPVTYGALMEAAAVAEETEGAYDPTWTSLLRVWGLRGRGEPRVPRDFEIEMALRRVDWSDVEVSDEGALQARRLNRRTEIDLGGLARGEMLDAAVAQLRLSGSPAGRASTKREHAVFGGTRRHPWTIPISIRGEEAPAGIAEMREGALAIASRGAPIETPKGETIHDRFDPREGRPAVGARWVAVVTSGASASAAYADALFAMGAEARAFVEAREELLAAIADDDGRLWVSRGLVVREQ